MTTPSGYPLGPVASLQSDLNIALIQRDMLFERAFYRDQNKVNRGKHEGVMDGNIFVHATVVPD